MLNLTNILYSSAQKTDYNYIAIENLFHYQETAPLVILLCT